MSEPVVPMRPLAQPRAEAEPSFADIVAELREGIAHGGRAETIARAAIGRLLKKAKRNERYQARNRLLLEAAKLVHATTWARAHRVLLEIKALVNGQLPESSNEVARIVAEALACVPLSKPPKTHHAIYKLLTRQ